MIRVIQCWVGSLCPSNKSLDYQPPSESHYEDLYPSPKIGVQRECNSWHLHSCTLQEVTPHKKVFAQKTTPNKYDSTGKECNASDGNGKS